MVGLKIEQVFIFAIFCQIISNDAKPLVVEVETRRFLGTRPDLFQGDVMLKEGQLSKNGVVDPSYRWPNGVVIYELDPRFTRAERRTIAASMAEFPKVSCVRFQQRTKNEKDYVFISRSGSGCWAHVGRNGGRQTVNLGPGCVSSGPVGHELMHAVGFHHEHCRMDRDDFMKILWNNIDPNYRSAFNKIEGLDTYGITYDYQSIMQYPGWGFSANGKDTMEPIPDKNTPFGQYQHLTKVDGQKMNAMYAGVCK